MAFYTNAAPGLRGINLKDGSTVWVEPGETVEVADKDVAHVHEDLEEAKSAPKQAKPDAE